MPEEDQSVPEKGIDSLIYDTLSHGIKQRKEILRMTSNSRFGRQSIENNLQDIHTRYEWARKEKRHDGVYYYRNDVGRDHKPSRTPADYSDIDALLRDCEIQLGIKQRNTTNLPTEGTEELPNLLNELLQKSQSCGKIFVEEKLLDRFFVIFDVVVEEIEEAYTIEDGQIPAYTVDSEKLIFLLVTDRYEKWKEGAAHPEMDSCIRDQTEKLVKLTQVVPPKIGSAIFSIIRIVDTENTRSAFKNMIQSNKYEIDDLEKYAHYSYIIQNDADKLSED